VKTFVEGTNDVLEGAELHHGVRNLSHPEGGETLVETVTALIGLMVLEAFNQSRM
jgi:hypothetical protein